MPWRKGSASENNGLNVVRPKLEFLTLEEAVETFSGSKLGLLMFQERVVGNNPGVAAIAERKIILIDPASDRARTLHGRA